jgi:hypothetical protein
LTIVLRAIHVGLAAKAWFEQASRRSPESSYFRFFGSSGIPAPGSNI